MKKMKEWIQGQIILETTGWGRERLINICKKNNIKIHNLKIIQDGYTFQTTYMDYKEVVKYNNKINTQITIKDKWGLPYFFYKYKKRKIFLICFLLFVIGIYAFSNYIWNISIIGNETYTAEELSKDITTNYVKIGSSKDKINCSELEKDLRNKYTDIAWISCDIKGTNLVVNIKETIPTNEIITIDEPCNIVAYKDSIVTDIIVNSGSKIIDIGDEVKKNDVLISGVVNVYNEYEELIETNYTSAMGTIWGIVEYNYNDEFDMESNHKEYTGNKKKTYKLNIANNHIELPFSENKYKNSDVISENSNIKLLENLYLPIGIYKETHSEYIITRKKLSEDEAYQLANKRLILYIDNLKKKGVSILENNVTISIENGKCISSGTIKCKEVVGIPSKLTITQEGEQK
ncbi:MAG: hypothetical protein E7263_00470 [Lachnospiraceae bacterium]|nr:hypothetical protein [Lachnospiraceae bacterium]